MPTTPKKPVSRRKSYFDLFNDASQLSMARSNRTGHGLRDGVEAVVDAARKRHRREEAARAKGLVDLVQHLANVAHFGWEIEVADGDYRPIAELLDEALTAYRAKGGR